MTLLETMLGVRCDRCGDRFREGIDDYAPATACEPCGKVFCEACWDVHLEYWAHDNYTGEPIRTQIDPPERKDWLTRREAMTS